MVFISSLFVFFATATTRVSQTLLNLTTIDFGINSSGFYYFFGAENVTQVAVSDYPGV
jgi:hypothetical protein